MMRDMIIAGIRTGVASVVGLAITLLIHWNIEVPAGFDQALTAVLFGGVVVLYNLLVSFLERKVSPAFGVLLGIPKAPKYDVVPGQVIQSHEAPYEYMKTVPHTGK